MVIRHIATLHGVFSFVVKSLSRVSLRKPAMLLNQSFLTTMAESLFLGSKTENRAHLSELTLQVLLERS